MLRDAEGGMPGTGSLHAYIAAHVRAPAELEGALHYAVVSDPLPPPVLEGAPPSPAAHAGEFLAMRRLVLVFFTPKTAETALSQPRHSFPGAGSRTRLADAHLLADVLVASQHSPGDGRPQTPFQHTFSAVPQTPSQVCGDLISALALGSSPEAPRSCARPPQRLLVFGMSVAEYAAAHEPLRSTRVYIQHVDTTGLVRPRRAQSAICRAVVRAYLGYAQAVLGAPYVHVFASPKPSLIFGGSEGLVGLKTVLDGPRLAAWWLSMLHQHAASLRTSSPVVTGHVYAPAEDRVPAFASSLRSWAAQNTSASVRWHYGYACCSQHSALGVDIGNSNEHVARGVFVPLFEDDPKWRHYEAVYLDGGVADGEESAAKRKRGPGHRRKASVPRSLSEFFQTLGYRSEFMHEPSALVALCQPVGPPRVALDTSGEAPCAAHVTKLMRTLSFATPEDAEASSLRVWAWLKVMGAVITEIAPAESDLFAPAQRSDASLADAHAPESISVQGLVRRKPVLAVRSSGRAPYFPSPMSSAECVTFPDAFP